LEEIFNKTETNGQIYLSSVDQAINQRRDPVNASVKVKSKHPEKFRYCQLVTTIRRGTCDDRRSNGRALSSLNFRKYRARLPLSNTNVAHGRAHTSSKAADPTKLLLLNKRAVKYTEYRRM